MIDMDLIPRKFFMDDLLDDFMPSKEENMKCDIYEKDGNYHIEMDVPGFDKKDIKIEAKKDSIIISAEKSIIFIVKEAMVNIKDHFI